MYLYGDLKIHSQSDITTEDDWEFKTVVCGRRKESVQLNREPGTDVWYDDCGNEARITVKKLKPIRTSSFYD
jgi:hypothetical protein